MVYFEYVYKKSRSTKVNVLVYNVSVCVHTFYFSYLHELKYININPSLPCIYFVHLIDQCLHWKIYVSLLKFSWLWCDNVSHNSFRRYTFNYNRYVDIDRIREMATILHMIQHATNKMCHVEHLGDFMLISV